MLADAKAAANSPTHVLLTQVHTPYLQRVVQHHTRPQRQPAAVNGPHHAVDEVGAVLKHVGPQEVEQVCQRVLTAQASNTQRQVLHHCGGSLAVHQVTVSQRILFVLLSSVVL